MRIFLSVFLSILMYGCFNKSDPLANHFDLKGKENITLNQGKCLQSVNGEYEICLESVNDSRCPVNVVCIWEGDAVVDLSFKSNQKTTSFKLHTHDNFQQDTVIDNIKIELAKVAPYPKSGTKQKNYTAELNITRQ